MSRHEAPSADEIKKATKPAEPPPPTDETDYGTEQRPNGGPGQAKTSPHEGLCAPFDLRPETDIPRRQWLYGRWCVRGFVSSLIGRSGEGKTSEYIAEALAVVTGRNLLGVQPVEPTAVWLLNLEDSHDEMERRIAAACAHHRVTNEQLGRRLYMDGLPPVPLIIAKRGFKGIEIDQDIARIIVDRIERHMIGLLVVVPLIASHTVSENDNGEMNAVILAWRTIAARTNCAILLVHHLGKGGDDDGRGASAVRDAVRTSRRLRRMTIEEGTRFALTEGEYRNYFTMLDAKNNLAELGVGTWFHLTSIRLANGDDVGVVEAWKPPGELDDIDPDDLDRVVGYLVEHGRQRGALQSPAWFGWTAAGICRVPGSVDQSETARFKANGILRTLGNQGRIKRTFEKIKGRDVPFWEAVGEAAEEAP